MIDTHLHLYDSAFDADRPQVVERALAAGITQCILPGINPTTYAAQQACAAAYPDFCRMAIGLHPTDINARYLTDLETTLAQLEAALSGPEAQRPVAIGEIGLDAYWSQEFLPAQIAAFEEQLRWSAQYHLPVIIHSRSCFPQLLEVLKRCRSLGLRGTLHAWSGSQETFLEANRYGHFKMGIGGVITFKNAHLAEVVAQTPISELVLETDAPWLTPTPFRGQRNEPAYMVYALQKVAQVKNLTVEETAHLTHQNALSLFA